MTLGYEASWQIADYIAYTLPHYQVTVTSNYAYLDYVILHSSITFWTQYLQAIGFAHQIHSL